MKNRIYMTDQIQRHLDVSSERISSRNIDSLRDCRFFITGGTGFLGSWLVDLLVTLNRSKNLGLKIVLLTRSVESVSVRRPDWLNANEIEFVAGDICSVRFPSGSFSHVVHAATDTTAAAARSPLGLTSTIVDGSRRLLAFAKNAGVRRYLYVSSGAVVESTNRRRHLIKEGDAAAPSVTDINSAYGNSKRFAEHLHFLHCDRGRFDVVIARGFAFVGPRMPLDGHFAIGNFIADAIRGDAPRVTGDGSAYRSYLFSADAAVWMLLMLIHGQAGRVYNLGSDEAISILDLATRVTRLLGAPPPIFFSSTTSASVRNYYVPSIDRAREELALDPWTSLDLAILETANWAKFSQRL